MKKKVLSILLTLVMVIGMLPGVAVPAAAAEDLAITGAYVGTSATDTSWVPATANGEYVLIDTPFTWVGTPVYVKLETNSSNPVTWSCVLGGIPSGLTLDGETGVISGTPDETYNGRMMVRATDTTSGENYSLWLYFGIYKESHKPVLATESCANGCVNNEYYQQLLLQPGFAANFTYTYSISKGALPDGLSIGKVDYDGRISGTPTKVGTFNFTVKVESLLGVNEKDYTIVIQEEPIRPSFSGNNLPHATRQAPYTVDLNDYLTGNYTKPITSWSMNADALAAVGGLTFDTATGILSGTPENTGTFLIYTSAGNAAGMTSCTFELKVYDQPAITTAESSRTAYVGESFNWQMTATGSSGGWSISKGSLPSGLHLSGDGVIWGQATEAGTFPITIRYKVSDELYVEKDLTITVEHTYKGYLSQNADYVFPSQNTGYTDVPELDVTLYNTGSGKLGNITYELTGTGASAFTVSGLVSSLAADSSDEFTVKPKTGLAAGNYAAILTVKNGDSALGGFGLSISVADPTFAPTITSPYKLPDVVKEKPTWSYQFQATGTKPITWTLNSVTLDGVDVKSSFALSSSGVLSGTPTSTGRYFVYVTAGNAVGNRSSQFELNVYNQPAITTESSRTAYVGESFNWQMTATGSSGAWSVSKGSLPSGLHLSGDGVIWGKPEEAGTFNFTVRYEVSDELYVEKALTITVEHTYKSTLSQKADYVFPSQNTGYTDVPELDVTLYNTGSGKLDNINYELTGINESAFTVSDLAFSLAADSSDEFTVKPKTGLAAGNYTATLTVKNGDTALGSFGLSFSVTNEVIAPDITSPSELPFAVEGEPWSYQFQATGTGPFTWTLDYITANSEDVSSDFTLNPTTGLLRLNGTPDWITNADGYVSLKITVANSSSRDTISPSFYCYTLPEVSFVQRGSETPFGSTYDNNYVESSLSNPPYFTTDNDCETKLEGSIPAGIELGDYGSWGLLQGAPTKAGTYTFRLKTTKTVDGTVIGTAVSDYLTMTVYEKPKFQEVHNLALPELTAMVPMTPIDLSALVTGGKAPLTYSINPNSVLPTGLSLDSATGIISGTPTVVSESIQIWPQFTVTDANGKKDTITFYTSACEQVQFPVPVISAAGDTFATSMTVNLSCPYTSATVYYTTDGTNPTEDTETFGPGSGGVITITEAMADENGVVTLKARAYAGNNSSEVVTKTFTVVDKPTAVTADPVSGTEFGGSLQVELDCSTAGTTIYYSTDPSLTTPMQLFVMGKKYSTPITLSANTTLRAVPVLRIDASTTVMGDVSTFTYTRNDRFGFELNKTALNFTAKMGYVSVASQSIAVENTGNITSNPLTVTLSGTGKDAFTIDSATVSAMSAGDTKVVTVTPKAGMPTGTYTATLTLDNDDVAPMTVNLRFTVTSVTLDGAASATDGINVTVEDLNSSATLMVAQYEGSKMVDVQTMTVSADDTYTMNELTHKTGCTYKAFLVNSTSYVPLCEAKPFS